MILCKIYNKYDEITPGVVRLYHRSYILNIMGISVLGMALEDRLETCGRVIKLFFKKLKFPKLY